MSIEAAVRAMLMAHAPLDIYPITHGYRLQDSILPAVTFEVVNHERSATKDHFLASVEVTTIAVETASALAIADDVRAACVAGTFLIGFDFNAVLFQGRTVTPPTVGEGDEQQPAECITRIDIYYKE